MKKLLFSLLLLLFGSVGVVNAQNTLSCGVPQYAWNAAAPGNGDSGTPYAGQSNVAFFTWQIGYSSSPASVTLLLEGSNDNSLWSTLDTSTNVGGEIRNVATSVRFIRATQSARSGGSGVTVILNCTRYSSGGGGGSASGYSVIEEDGSALTSRSTLNFVGAGVTCVDDVTKTECTVSVGSAGAGFVVDTDGSGSMAARELTNTDGLIDIQNGDGTAGNPVFNINKAAVNTFSSGTGDVPATGDLGTLYFETDTNGIYMYPSTNTETWLLSIAAGATAGQLFQTSATDVLAAITSTDDNILVSDGSTWAKKTLPDCDDSGGNHLNYDTGTNAFTCGTSGSSSFDPDTTIDKIEEFVGRGTATVAIGEWGWATSTGAGASEAVSTPDTGHWGMSDSITGVTDNIGQYILANSHSSGDLTSSNFILTFYIRMTEALTSTGVYIGLSSGHTGTDSTLATAGIQFRYDTDRSDTNWTARICDSVTSGCNSNGDDTNQDVFDTGTPPVEDTWVELELEHDVTGVGGVPTYYFRINDVQKATFCSSGCDEDLGNLPAVTVHTSLGIWARATTASKTLQKDWVRVRFSGLSR